MNELLKHTEINPDLTGVTHKDEEVGLWGLAGQMNTGVAWGQKGHSLIKPVDSSMHDTQAFTPETLKEEVGKIEDPYVRSQIVNQGVNDWESYEKAKRYIGEFRDQQVAVANEFSTAQQLLYGLPMALIDIDSVLINPTLKVASMVQKSLKITSALGKATMGAVSGGAIGAESMIAYEATTGVKTDGSIVNASLLGMALGGGLGAFMGRTAKTKDTFTNDVGETVNKNAVKEEELALARTEMDEINEAVNIRNSITASRKTAKESVKVGAKVDKKTIVTELKESLGARATQAKDAVVTATEKLKNLTTSKKTLIKTNKGTRKAVEKLKKERDESKVASEDISFIAKSVEKLKQEQLRLKTNIGQSLKYGEAHAKGIAKKFGAKLEKIEKELAKGEAEIAKLKAKMTWTPEKSKLLKEANDAYIATAEILHKSGKDIRAHELAVTEAKTKKKVVDAENRSTKAIPEDSAHTVKQREKLARAEELLSDEGFAKLLGEKGMLESKIKDLEAGDLSLMGYKKQQENYIQKLEKELNNAHAETVTLESMKKSGQFKSIPKWMQKLIISPIEKLLTSDNSAVRGLASLLHTGTLSRGALNQNTASTIRTRLNVRLNEAHRTLREAHKEALRSGETTKKFEEWDIDVAIEANAVVGKMQREASEGIDGAIQGEARLEKIRENLEQAQRKYTGNSPALQKGVDSILDYYESVHKNGKGLGMDTFQGVGKGYLPRHYDDVKINAMGRETAIAKIVDAQTSWASHHNINVDATMLKDFNNKATHAVDSSLEGSSKLKAVTQPYGKTREKTSTSRLSERSIQAFDDDLADILEMDVVGSSAIYGLSVHGRQALMEKLGIQSLEEIETMLDLVGATVKEKDNLRVIIDTILGHREMTKNPFTIQNQAISMVSSYSSMMHTMGFGIPTLTEFFSISKEFGFASTVKHLVPSVKSIYGLYRHGTTADVNQIGLVAEFGTALMGHKVNRLDIGDNIAYHSRGQEFMDGVTRKESIWGGLMPITDALKLTTISAGADFLARATVRKLSKTDVKRLEDMGFTLEDLPKIKEALQVDASGKIGNMNSKSWGEYQTKITDGLTTLVNRTILHPDGSTLPKFMTDVNEGAFLSKIIMKFMKFPVESIERMGLRGMQHADAKQGMALAGNIALWSLILMAKDSTKDEGEERYDMSTSEGMTALMKDSFMANSWTGGMTSMVDKASGVLTGENIFSDYKANITGAGVGDIEKLLWKKDPTFNAYGNNIHIGDAVADIMSSVTDLDEAMKD